MKIPRDVNGPEAARALRRAGYEFVRQTQLFGKCFRIMRVRIGRPMARQNLWTHFSFACISEFKSQKLLRARNGIGSNVLLLNVGWATFYLET